MITRNSILATLVLAVAAAVPTFAQNTVQPAAPATPTMLPAPATPPAPIPVTTPAAARTSPVLVIPFVTLNLAPDQKWIGQAIQETLIADLGKSPTYSASPFVGQTIVEDNAAAIRLAKDANLPYAIRGAAQVVNGEVRLTAQLLNAKTGDTVSTAIVTGPTNNLLKLEDQLSIQLGITPLPAPAAVATPTAPSAPLAPAYAMPQPTYTPPQPVYSQPNVYALPVYPPEPFNDISLNAQNYNPPYDYPVYSSPIYYSGFSPIFIGGRGFNHFPQRGGFGGNPGFHFGGGVHIGGFGGGIHNGGGFSGGGMHTGGGFSGGHGGGRR